jgi:hypothetical protein
VKDPSIVPTAATEQAGGSVEAVSGTFSPERFERILRLQRQAIYPLDPVGAMMAQSQLAQVEVPWLTRQLQLAQRRLLELTGGGSY